MGYFTNEKRNGYKDFHFNKGTTSIVFEGLCEYVSIKVTQGFLSAHTVCVPDEMTINDGVINIKFQFYGKEININDVDFTDFVELAAALGVVTHDLNFSVIDNKAIYTCLKG